MKTNKTNLITVAAIVIAGTFVLPSCDKKEREQLRAQADSLQQKLQERDSAFNSIMTVMAEVESQIEQIKQQENILVSTNTGDFTEDTKNQMVSDMQKISKLINDTNDKVASLSSKLEKSNIELNAFKKKLQAMTNDLKDRENAIVQLQQELEAKNIQIAELDAEVQTLVDRVQNQTETIEVQSQEIAEKTKDLNTAYFAVNTEKKLVEEGLISKEGGFLWMGKTAELKADAAQSKFTQVDIRDTKKFYVDSEKMKLITEHPSDSYKLVKEGEKVKYLEVTNAEEFWKISKYLVIAIKG